MGKRKKYTDDFKRDAVRMMRNRGMRTVAEVADDLGVPANHLHRWAKLLDADAVAKRNEQGETLEDEVRRLRKENERLRMEKAILKNRRGRRPTCWARSSWRATTAPARKSGRLLFGGPSPLKNMVQGALRSWHW